jgi:26S proteasome regulatory subunit N6
MKVTNENIEWARSEKRVFLRQSLEIKLIGQYVYLTSKRDDG